MITDTPDIPATSLLLPEWAEQDAVLLAWPHENTDWAANLAQIELVYLEIIAAITRFERVVLLVDSASLLDRVKQKLVNAEIETSRIVFIITTYNDTWLRDTGPLSVQTNNKTVLYDFRFNGWGGKYDASDDDLICKRISQSDYFSDKSFISHDIFLEGGSIDTNGIDSLLTTRQCLLSETRNPDMLESDYEILFSRIFGSRQVHWIENSMLIGDDTDGHIDMLARFCDEKTIAYTSCNDREDPHFESLQRMEEELRSFKTIDRQSYKLAPLPLPEAKLNINGKRLPASYANFLIINNAVLVPTYADDNDVIAIKVLSHCFPDRAIIGINALPIIEQFGSLHCLTMQLSKAVE